MFSTSHTLFKVGIIRKTFFEFKIKMDRTILWELRTGNLSPQLLVFTQISQFFCARLEDPPIGPDVLLAKIITFGSDLACQFVIETSAVMNIF